MQIEVNHIGDNVMNIEVSHSQIEVNHIGANVMNIDVRRLQVEVKHVVVVDLVKCLICSLNNANLKQHQQCLLLV